MKQFEYTTEIISYLDAFETDTIKLPFIETELTISNKITHNTKLLAELGDVGWELLAIVHQGSLVIGYFKREKVLIRAIKDK